MLRLLNWFILKRLCIMSRLPMNKRWRCDFEHGTLIEHPSNPALVDCILISGNAHYFWLVVAAVAHSLSEARIFNYQLMINHGRPAHMYHTALQIKLYNNADKRRLLRQPPLAEDSQQSLDQSPELLVEALTPQLPASAMQEEQAVYQAK